jgi:molecular chaperone DnaK (HSP70)
MKNTVKNSRVVGIDLGTTNSVIAFVDGTGKAKVIPNADGEFKTPSVVYSAKGLKEVLVGEAARNMQIIEPGRTFCEFKRDIATDKVYLKEQGQEITPERCQTELLKSLRQAAINYFNDDLAASKAVISVPAYFGERERQAVKHSAELAAVNATVVRNQLKAANLATNWRIVFCVYLFGLVIQFLRSILHLRRLLC